MTEKPVGSRLADLEARVAELERQLSNAVFHERVRETPVAAAASSARTCGVVWEALQKRLDQQHFEGFRVYGNTLTGSRCPHCQGWHEPGGACPRP